MAVQQSIYEIRARGQIITEHAAKTYSEVITQ